MGLLDKAKATAAQAAARAQQQVQQMQMQQQQQPVAGRAPAPADPATGLLADLGRAYYAQARAGGAAESVTAALAAVDAHVGQGGSLEAPPPPPPASPAPSAAAAMPAGDFSLDDM